MCDGDIVLQECLHLVLEPGWKGAAHTHGPHHELVLVLAGRMRTRAGDRVLESGPGDLVVYPQQVRHAPASVGKEPLETILFRWQGGESVLELERPCVCADRDGRMRHQLEWILDIYPSRNSSDRCMIQTLAHTAIHELSRLQNPTPCDMAECVRRYIRAHMAEKMSLDDLAEVVGLSKYHFARTFKRVTNQTPMRLLTQMRVEAAQALILQTDLPLEAVARRVGLADASHLSHLFRRVTDRSPGSLRRSRRGQKQPAG
jgi:AraC-like DNA-binding protein